MTPYRVCIRNVETGEERIEVGEWDESAWGDVGTFQFNWLENNFSCDCNRHLQFLRAGGPGPQDDPNWNEADRECGNKAYEVPWLEFGGQRLDGDERLGPNTSGDTQ